MQIKVQNSDIRIDKYLKDELDISRSLIQKMIEEEYILVNEAPVKASYNVQINDLITIKEGFVKETSLLPDAIKLDIVYEDKDLIVINKVSGMVVHPGNGNIDKTLVNALMHHTNLSDNEEDRPGIVHRLDKDTSGLIVAAKNNKTHELLTEMFKNREVEKKYIALVIGEILENSGTIDAPIGRDQMDRKKMTVTDKNSKEAISEFKVLKRYNGYTLLELNLLTGRTHQLRVHLKYIGYPIYNDPVYAKGKHTSFGQFLHSSKLAFKHPISDKYLEFTTDVPFEFKKYLESLEELSLK
ncbi:MAG: RluA family pseudouridine synthase [Bacilli bacterium]|nr:RluA family pseudouridine synthase [Bacilli bacterium]